MFGKYFLIAWLPLILIVGCGRGQTTDSSHTIPPAEFYQQIKKDTTAIVVDVRTPGEYSEGHIPGALNIDYRNEDFENKIKLLDHTKTTLIYCQSGKRSSAAMVKMQNWGFKSLFELKGGFAQWKTANLPEEK